MRKKRTDELLKIISQEKDLQKYLTDNAEEFENAVLYLELDKLLQKYNRKKADIIRLSNLDKTYVYQIFDGTRQNPSRDKLLAICIACGADLPEIQRILCTGHCQQLYPRRVRDSIIIYGITHKHSVSQINETLYDMRESILE